MFLRLSKTYKMEQLVYFRSFRILFIILLYLQLPNKALLDVQQKYQQVTEDPELYNLYTQKDVEILTINNIKEAIVGSKKAWVVEYYSKWCGSCIQLAPSRKEFATDVRGWSDLVVIAALDCSNEINYPLCQDYKIAFYPTLRYYHEDFQEEPKNYSFAMNRGMTAIDHRKNLVNTMISEQREGRGKHFPNLLPFNINDTKTIFDGVSDDVKYAVLIVQEPTSLLGPEITLDLHKTQNLIVRYASTNNTDLVTTVGGTTFPALYIIGRGQHVERLMANSNDRHGFIEALTRDFRLQDIKLAIDHADGATDFKKKEEAVLMHTVKNVDVFQMDLETTTANLSISTDNQP